MAVLQIPSRVCYARRMHDFPTPHWVQPASQIDSVSIGVPEPMTVMAGRREVSTRPSATRSRQNSPRLVL